MLRTHTVILLVSFAAAFFGCSSSDSSGGGSAPDPLIAAAGIDAGISTDSLASHVRYLASDELEGRAPGSRGQDLTLNYLAEEYADLGLRPGSPDGMYVQAVPLMGSTLTNVPTLQLRSDGGNDDMHYHDDFMAWTHRQTESVTVRDAELIFVGYGIIAPEYGWNDYKDVDVTGKVLVMLVGDPPLADSTMFGGKAMTYYGRWTYKYEIAAEKGAAGAIIVHNTKAAGYPWSVVSNSWSGEQFDIVRPNKGADRCAMEAWVTEPAAQRVFAAAGLDVGDAYRMALSPDFRPIPLRASVSIDLRNTFRRVKSYNVVALLPGSDPQLKDEVVIYTAHWDHLGVGNPVDGDSIYNGALDNASGVAGTLEIARAFLRNRGLMRRSVLFINTTAEESGLLGAYYYTDHPLFPLAKTAALINIDGLNIWGRTRDVVVVGYGFSDLDDYLRAALASQKRFLKPDTEPEKGYYYRSDHFPFAKKGVPSLYADSGVEYVGRPREWGIEAKDAYTSERYHKPQDEMLRTWDLSGAAEDLEAFFRVGLMVASTDVQPQWSAKSEFRAVRERSQSAGR
jgi:Zn-dependent M28 family amino/carboxypeptidase